MSNVAVASLTPDSARRALDVACRTATLRPDSAELVRFGENALFCLPDHDLVARVGRSTSAAIKEVHVSCWLAENDLPASELASIVEQPLVALGYPVSFWRMIHEADTAPSSADLGHILRFLHSLPEPDLFNLPRFEPMPKVTKRLRELSGAFSLDIVHGLRDRHRQILEELSSITFALEAGPIHGDAHRGNLMRAEDGTVIMIDLEDFMYGPREWDILVEASHYKPFGWSSADDYRDFCAAYGFDVMTWPGYETLLAARQLNMTTWLMQRHGESSNVDDEIMRRIQNLLSGNVSRAWTIR